jgi:predicted lipid-binding transport protein (Tim44 family)
LISRVLRPTGTVIALQVLELLIFAVLAGVVLYQLYAVLGRRVGRQPEDNPEPARRASLELVPAQSLPPGSPALVGAAAIKAKDPAFDLDKFLASARSAFEMIVPAFAAGDRETLRPLLSPEVSAAFETAMVKRETEGRTESVEFLQQPRADLEDVAVEGDTAVVKVRFLAEFRNRSKGPEGEAVDDRRTAEVWTFQRAVISKDPNWILARVEAAEA